MTPHPPEAVEAVGAVAPASDLRERADESGRGSGRGSREAVAVAAVTRCEARNGVWALTIRCPFCGRRHHHGGGATSGDPVLGERVSHCHRGTYELHSGQHRDVPTSGVVAADEVRCPYGRCGALPGEPCVTPSGEPRDELHGMRRNRATARSCPLCDSSWDQPARPGCRCAPLHTPTDRPATEADHHHERQSP